MNIKVVLAAAVLASVGTFAFADSHQGCGDANCNVGTVLNGDAPVDAGHKERGSRGEYSGLDFSTPGWGMIGAIKNDDGLYQSGNCLGDVGSNGDSGCN